jgi:hypothetical protein
VQKIIDIIRKATDALPDPPANGFVRQAYSARDWAAFFAAVSAFLQKLIPLIIPLLVAAQPDNPK